MKISGKKVILRNKKPADADNDYRWQTDKELSALDAVTPVDLTFEEFYREYLNWMKHPYPNRITFAVETNEGKHIGNCVYYNIDRVKAETEIGIMIGERDYWNHGYGADTISTLIDYIFQRLKFKRVYLKTLGDNFHAQRCFQKCGLVPCGYLNQDGYRFLQMDMSCSQWQELRKRESLKGYQ